MRLPLLLWMLLFPFLLTAENVVFVGSASDSELFANAFKHLKLPEKIRFRYYCTQVDADPEISRAVREADVLIVNARGRDVRRITEANFDAERTRLYALSSRLLKKGIPAKEPPELKAYRANSRPENFRNMVYWVVHRELDKQVKFEPPSTLPPIGVTHPGTRRVYGSIPEFQAKSKHFRPDLPVIAFAVHSASINRSELALFKAVTDECEKQGLNVLLVYGDEVKVIRRLLLDPRGRSYADAVLALSFKFKTSLGEELRLALKDLDRPVFNALRIYRQTTPEWEKSPLGMNNFSVAFAFIAPEISGLIEPSLLFGTQPKTTPDGRKIQVPETFPAAIRQTVSRLKKWTELRRKKNSEKKIAVFIYNASGGKQNIGASYLNVPRSLVRIIRAMAQASYRTGGLEKLTEPQLTAELIRTARNIGSWAPGELDSLINGGDPVLLPLKTYEKWFAALPENFRKKVTAEWGAPRDSKIMFANGHFILPMLQRGNLVILPEPLRGWLDDPHKLLHSSTIAPPHQYLAVYLWLRHEFRADAMIHLGRHGSSEWLPGKQLGLDAADAPEIVRGNIPEIYPYISDGIGEGIIAKRRARAVMIAHLTPLLKTPSGEDFLPRLNELVSECQSAPPSVRPDREKNLREFLTRHRLAERLKLDFSRKDWFEQVSGYTEKRAAPTPFGLHAFGESPSEAEINAMRPLLPEKGRAAIERHLKNTGRDELSALLHALDGGFIEPGPSGDPLRNPRMLPAGRNFYSFDPDKVPSPAAMKKGAALAEKLLASEMQKKGALPRSAAILLWAGESVRTDGVNEAMALALMGMTLRYDRSGRIAGVVPVPGSQLRRPRIEVVITASGAYRDQFGSLLRLLDSARRQAARLTDAENFIQGDKPGIFFPKPGTYGTRVNKLAGASGSWEKSDDLAEVYLRSMSHTLDGQGNFTVDPKALAGQLGRVETVLQSRSSNVYGVTDIDEMYQYLGGLTLAAGKLSGKSPAAYIADLRDPASGSVGSLKNFLAAELDSRLFNPEWIKSMVRENYAGGKTLSRITDNFWGWQAVTPENITAADWSSLYEIYVQDRYKLGLKKFFAGENEWAYQSMTARMLEAVRKDYWNAPQKLRQTLAAEYAASVIRQGMACCDHTCNNPMLNQMVLNLISLPGVMSPEMSMKFRAAVEKAGGASLDKLIRDRQEKMQKARTGFGKRIIDPVRKAENREKEQAGSSPAPSPEKPVRGFKMKPQRQAAEKTTLSSSGLQWTILTAVVLLIAVFAFGAFRKAE
ncbi:MAG: cobaltochelatase subunit CobN [Lentisphaerae bacterium]|nr:cobaltochelatase subunit CobN [Lentisphaerota bacterium]